MAKVLLIGAAGLVGRHIRAALAGRPHIATFHSDPVEDAIALDLTDGAAVRRVIADARPSAIVLAAADAFVERCERQPEETRHVNVDAAAVVRDAAAAAKATLVVFSSEYVFDGSKGTYAETDPVAPINEYGRQKVDLERIAASLDRHLILRISGVFGDEPRRKNFVWQLVDRLRSGQEFTVPSDQLITPTDALTLAGVVMELLDRGLTGTFHAAGPEVMGRVDFANEIARVFALDASRIVARPTASLGLAAPRPARAGLSDRKLQDALGHGLARPTDALRRLAS